MIIIHTFFDEEIVAPEIQDLVLDQDPEIMCLENLYENI